MIKNVLEWKEVRCLLWQSNDPDDPDDPNNPITPNDPNNPITPTDPSTGGTGN